MNKVLPVPISVPFPVPLFLRSGTGNREIPYGSTFSVPQFHFSKKVEQKTERYKSSVYKGLKYPVPQFHLYLILLLYIEKYIKYPYLV